LGIFEQPEDNDSFQQPSTGIASRWVLSLFEILHAAGGANRRKISFSAMFQQILLDNSTGFSLL
jgi:hypothetical protein